jgi:5-hydroxyisourate hydrolase
MIGISTHVLDTARGVPAIGVPVALDFCPAGGEWRRVGGGVTDGEGRIRDVLAPDSPLGKGIYRLIFDTAAYLGGRNILGFYPEVIVVIEVRDASQHYHVPLLLSPFGYSTYRGT